MGKKKRKDSPTQPKSRDAVQDAARRAALHAAIEFIAPTLPEYAELYDYQELENLALTDGEVCPPRPTVAGYTPRALRGMPYDGRTARLCTPSDHPTVDVAQMCATLSARGYGDSEIARLVGLPARVYARWLDEGRVVSLIVDESDSMDVLRTLTARQKTYYYFYAVLEDAKLERENRLLQIVESIASPHTQAPPNIDPSDIAAYGDATDEPSTITVRDSSGQDLVLPVPQLRERSQRRTPQPSLQAVIYLLQLCNPDKYGIVGTRGGRTASGASGGELPTSRRASVLDYTDDELVAMVVSAADEGSVAMSDTQSAVSEARSE